MGRRAVAATLVSLLVFTTMLGADGAVYSSESSSLGSAVLATVQLRERDYGGLLVGLSAFRSLAEAQSYLNSNTFDCSSPQAYLDLIAGRQQYAGASEGIAYSTVTSWAYSSEPAGENGSAYVPGFSGYQNGALNLEVTTSVEESYNDGLPSYSFQTVGTVHLQVPLDAIISGCVAALSDLGAALSSLTGCNSSAVAAALNLADSSFLLLDTYVLGASASPLPTGCLVDYWVATTVLGLGGVSGAFQWSVRGEGSLAT